MACKYLYQGKEYTKESFYDYVKNNLVEGKVVPKYERILFPSGNTSMKIEGHTTLEEFKKQKEDRLKELEDKLNLLPNIKIEENSDGFFNFKLQSGITSKYGSYTKDNVLRELESYKKVQSEELTREIVNLKQELSKLKSGRIPMQSIISRTILVLIKNA